MGICNCCKKPIPPPQKDLIGQWLMNRRSRYFRIGSGENRYKKGTNLLGVGLTGPPNAEAVCRLNIKQDGMIGLYCYTPEQWIALQGPVYSWKNGKIKSISKQCLNYDISYLKDKKLLIVNDMVLKRAQDIPND